MEGVGLNQSAVKLVLSHIFNFDKFSCLLIWADIVEGQGLEAHEGDLIEFNYVCRRSNGYFVHRYRRYSKIISRNETTTC